MVHMKCKSSLIWLILLFFLFFFSECFSGLYFKYSSRHHSALIRWSHQSFSWSTWSALNAGWCAPLSCRAWAGALSDWSSSTPSTTDSDTETTPEIGWGGETGEKRQTWIQLKARYLRQSSTDARLGRCADWSCCTTGAREPRAKRANLSLLVISNVTFCWRLKD